MQWDYIFKCSELSFLEVFLCFLLYQHVKVGDILKCIQTISSDKSFLNNFINAKAKRICIKQITKKQKSGDSWFIVEQKIMLQFRNIQLYIYKDQKRSFQLVYTCWTCSEKSEKMDSSDDDQVTFVKGNIQKYWQDFYFFYFFFSFVLHYNVWLIYKYI